MTHNKLGLRLLFAISASSFACGQSCYVVPPVYTEIPANYAEWAHYHWVWLNRFDQNQQNMTDLVHGYQSRNISVGAINIDSGWSTGFNNFDVDTKKFPDIAGLVKQMHEKDIRVLLWVTSMVNNDSSNYKEGDEKGYFVKNSFGYSALVKWWHGYGSLLDYTNFDARQWWHSQMDKLLDIGIDGWKTDGTDPYIEEILGPHGQYGPISLPNYQYWYYGDFYNHTKGKNKDGLIMSRPVDSTAIKKGDLYAFMPFSPYYVMFSGWVGDQDPSFLGIKDALANMIVSAWFNYTNFGSDIGGYRGGKRTAELMIRWTQLGAFSPLMENGGENVHTPWSYESSSNSTFVTDVYRKFVNQHYELVPYFVNIAAKTYLKGASPITPQAEKPTDYNPIHSLNFSSFAYLLGDQIFFQPVVDSGVVQMNVSFPSSGNWYSLFEPSQTFQGGQSYLVEVPLETAAAFGKQGAILPLHVSTSSLHNGDRDSADSYTLVIHTPDQSGKKVIQGISKTKTSGFQVTYQAINNDLHLNVSAIDENIIILLRGLNGTLQASDYSEIVIQNSINLTSILDRDLPRIFDQPPSEAMALGLSIAKKQNLSEKEPYWFSSNADDTPTQCDEIFIRAGSAKNGLRIILKNFTFDFIKQEII